MHDIFISYSRENISQAKLIAKVLEQKGFSVWWDRKIPAGKSFDEVIENAIDNSKCVIILWSAHSVKSTWARTEAEEGRNRGILIPVLIEDVRIPLAFRNIQAANLIKWDNNPDDPNFVSFLNDIRLLVPKGSLEKNKIVDDLTLSKKKESRSDIDITETKKSTVTTKGKIETGAFQKKEQKEKDSTSDKKTTPDKDQIKSDAPIPKIKPSVSIGKKTISKIMVPVVAIIVVVVVVKIIMAQNEERNKSAEANKMLEQQLMEKDSIEYNAWQMAKSDRSPSSIQSYLKLYPSGKFTNDANALLNAIQDSLDWQTAVSVNTKASYEDYLKNNPNGKQKSIASEKITELKNLKIGQQYQGGIIFYIDSTGEHGLIAAPMDQANGVTWGNVYVATGARDPAIGAGKGNTELIVKKLGEGKYAAKICTDLVLNGYDDWYLPSKDELFKLYENRNEVGGFKRLKYFSSTEAKMTYAGGVVNYASYCRDFGNGSGGRYLHSAYYNVRAVRSF